MSTEADLHKMVCDYLKLQYKGVIFRTDFAAGIKLSKGMAGRHARLQQSRAWPDLFIAEPRGGFYGAFIELKREGTKIRTRNGELVKDPHIREQYGMLKELDGRGYFAGFGIGFDHVRELLDAYLSGQISAEEYELPTGPPPIPSEEPGGLPF